MFLDIEQISDKFFQESLDRMLCCSYLCARFWGEDELVMGWGEKS
jgi:hypothetical protein